MLRTALNIDRSSKPTNEHLHGKLISDSTAFRRMNLTGHCLRHREETESELVLWQPSTRKIWSRQAMRFPDIFMQNTGIENLDKLKIAMIYQENWRQRAEM